MIEGEQIEQENVKLSSLDKYTTAKIKADVSKSKTIDKEVVEKEIAKTEITEEAFAICDYLNQLTKFIEALRVSFLTR